MRSMNRFRSWVTEHFATRGAASFLTAALVLGVLVGLGAAVLVWTTSVVFSAFRSVDDTLGWGKWLLIVSIPIGLLTAWLLNRWFGPGVASGGVTETILGTSLHGGYLPTRLIPNKIVATAATLGLGGSGGREGPIALIGGTIGSSFARYTGFGQDQIQSLVAAGAGAGVGASFNAPIAGMLFAMEVILRSFSVRHLNAIVITSVMAAVVTQQLVGQERLLTSPAYDLADPFQLVLYAVLAVVAVLFGVAFIRVLASTSAFRVPRQLPGWLLPVGAGVIIGTLGFISPNSLGTGQRFLSGLLAGGSDSSNAWYALFALAGIKILTTALTRAGGGSVGTFMGALFIGGAVGSGFAQLVDPLWTFSELDPGAFAVVGMAATFAAVARAPLTSVIIVFEITGNYGLVLPLMLGAALATFLGDRLYADSAYTVALTRDGIHLPTNQDIDLLDTINVGEVMASIDRPANPAMTVDELTDLLDRTRHHGVPVVDGDRLVGVCSYTDIARAESGDVPVASIMTPRPITVTAGLPVSAALARMASLGLGRLPVVSDSDPGELVGMFRRESVVRAYHAALGTATGRELYRERVRLRSQPDASFFEMPVMRGSPIANVLVKDVPWPESAILVSVRRGTAVVIPHGNTMLQPTDALTFFGTADARVELGHILEPAGAPTSEWQME
ncbi:MAG: chloride channel protein [Acidimicrobiia bacterium]|nr:MAG: chloride channel protein [Acidimicrobiia bacterium]